MINWVFCCCCCCFLTEVCSLNAANLISLILRKQCTFFPFGYFRLLLRDVSGIGDIVSRILWCLALIGTVYSYVFHEKLVYKV